MNDKNKNYFSVGKIKNEEINKQLLNLSLGVYENEDFNLKENRSNINHYESINILGFAIDAFSELLDFLLSNSQKTLGNTDKKLSIVEAKVNVNIKNSYNIVSNDLASDSSLIVFVKTTSSGGELLIPHVDEKGIIDLSASKYNYIKPEEGTIVIFNSSVPFGINIVNGDEPQICIIFKLKLN